MLLLLALLVSATSLSLIKASKTNRSFVVDPDANCFRKDGQCYQYISGSLHYYRIPEYYWRDRLLKLKGAGFNTLQTYIPWNVHEPVKGAPLNFSGRNNLFSFLKLCQDLDILVLLRPGPFIASEFEFGGFPSWLLIESPEIRLRTSEPAYLKNVLRWFNIILPELTSYLYQHGGPVIGVQIENEYGSNPACDLDYLRTLTLHTRHLLGPDVMLYSVDGTGKHMFECGALPGLLYNTVDFGGGNISQHFALQAEYNSGGPPVNTEYYPGWLSHWGSKYPSKSRSVTAAQVDEMLAFGASISMYMFHGGTNFGYTSGAKGNKDGTDFVPHTTSYDYDAPLSEAGDTTLKYWDIRQVVKKYSEVFPVPRNTTKKRYGKVEMKYAGSILNATFVAQCGKKTGNKQPLSFEENNQTNGVIVYSRELATAGELRLGKVRDRAYLLVDSVWVGTVKGSAVNSTLRVPAGKLDIIVVSDGHINTGHVSMAGPRGYMKGLVEPVFLDDSPLLDWDVILLPLADMSCLKDMTYPNDAPRGSFAPGSLFVGQLTGCDEKADTFVDTSGWGKGVTYFQEENLGRHWPLAGPQLTLFAPAPFCKGRDQINILMVEFEQGSDHVILTDTANLHGPIDPSQL